MDRRKYLATIGVATGTALAGCSGETGENNSSLGGSSETGSEPSTDAGSGSGATGDESAATKASSATNTDASGDETEVETDSEVETSAEAETSAETQAGSGSDGSGFSETYSGSGASAEEGLQLSPGPILAEFSHSGESNFIVTLVTLEGESFEDITLSNEIGDAEGSQAATVTADGEYNLDIDADGEWEIALEQPTDPDVQSLPFDESGDGSSYIGPYEFSGPTTFQGSHDGESNFIVSGVPIDPSAIGVPGVFNEIGQVDGETTSRVNGVAYLNISADGSWTLSGGE